MYNCINKVCIKNHKVNVMYKNIPKGIKQKKTHTQKKRNAQEKKN